MAPPLKRHAYELGFSDGDIVPENFRYYIRNGKRDGTRSGFHTSDLIEPQYRQGKYRQAIAKEQGFRCAISGDDISSTVFEIDHIVHCNDPGCYTQVVDGRFVRFLPDGKRWHSRNNLRAIRKELHDLKSSAEKSLAGLRSWGNRTYRQSVLRSRKMLITKGVDPEGQYMKCVAVHEMRDKRISYRHIARLIGVESRCARHMIKMGVQHYRNIAYPWAMDGNNV